MRYLTVILLICILPVLSGCLPVAFVAGATAGGAVVYDKRDAKTQFNDRNIAKQANYQINQDPELKKQARISLAVFDGVVLMVGQVPNDEARQRAYQIVMNVPNVKRVYNQLEVAGKISLGAQSNDSWITSKVKTVLLAKPGLHSTQIKVVTENSVVYLMGIVGRKQADLAAETARHVKGVRQVVKVFEYE